MDWVKNKLDKLEHRVHHHLPTSHGSDNAPPPQWAPAPETSHDLGRYDDASSDDFNAGERFCEVNPVWSPRLLPSDIVERIETEGCRAWGLEPPTHPGFVGRVSDPAISKGGPGVVNVTTDAKCKDTCILSNFPIAAGLYEIGGKDGVYFEITVHRMGETIAIGTACRPYPPFRLPGWNRLSAALHLDDLRKFWQDPNGGMDYTFPHAVEEGDTVGCGYDFAATSVFFTYNGVRLASAFGGIYVPRSKYDVYAAVGVSGAAAFDVNFGGAPFRWKEGNEWGWRVEGHVGRLSEPGPSSALSSEPSGYNRAGFGGFSDDLPTYAEARTRRNDDD